MVSLRSSCCALFVLVVFAIPSFADACKPSSLAAISGTTCDIGNLRFTFSYPGANESLFDLATGKYLSYQPISSMTFTPFVEGSKAGFTFGGLPSIELSGRDTHLAAEASVYYQVVPLQGKIVQVGAVAGGAAASAWGYGLNGSYVLSRSYTELAYSVSPSNSWLATDLVGVLASADGPAQGSPWTALQPMPFCSYCGYTSWASIVSEVYTAHNFLGAPSSGVGGGTTSITSGTFVFETDAPQVPEPSALALLSTGGSLIAFLAGKKSRHKRTERWW